MSKTRSTPIRTTIANEKKITSALNRLESALKQFWLSKQRIGRNKTTEVGLAVCKDFIQFPSKNVH